MGAGGEAVLDDEAEDDDTDEAVGRCDITLCPVVVTVAAVI